MNKVFKIFAICFLLTNVLFSCNEEKNDELSEPYFEVASKELTLNFVAEYDFRYITVKTNKDFTATSSQTWCTVTVVEDKVDNLKIVVQANGEFGDRTAEIVVTSQGFDNIIISINQNRVPVLTVKETEAFVDERDFEFSLEITANILVAFELPDWIQEKTGNPASDGKTWTFVTSRMAPGERSGMMVVKSEDVALGKRVNIPVVQRINVSRVGLWLFDDPQDMLRATIGKPLVFETREGYPYASVEGPSPTNKAIRLPRRCHLFADHEMLPKTGENFISEYTIFFEFKVPTFTIPGIATSYYPFFKTRINESATDGDVLLRGSDRAIGIGATGYGGAVVADTWNRLYLSYKPGEIRYYMNGVRIINSTSTDARFRINLEGVLFCTNAAQKYEYNEWDIAEIALWNGALTEEKIAELENSR